MVEFNSDGSIKLPTKLAKKQADDNNRMSNSRCMHIRKEIVSSKSPKSCALHLTLSNKIIDNRFIETIYSEFRRDCEVPSKLIKLNEKEFKIEIGTCFQRCSNCTSLIQKYNSFLNSNIIEKQSSCTFKQNMQSRFSYEDYFD